MLLANRGPGKRQIKLVKHEIDLDLPDDDDEDDDFELGTFSYRT